MELVIGLVIAISLVTAAYAQSCPQDWRLMGSRCYWVYLYADSANEDRTWTAARTNCQLAGGYLVSINDVYEDNNVNIIRRVAGILDDSYYWIGLSDRTTEGVFEWEDGSPADFVKFLSSAGEPNSRNPTDPLAAIEDYVVASGKYLWSDVRNDWSNIINTRTEPSGFICETAAELPPGPQGLTGLNGPPGSSGPMGLAGPPGTTGSPGRPGSPGPMGVIGPTGPLGSSGDKGEQGINGSPGLKGETGRPGTTGSPGQQGPTGSPGPMGVRGPTGIMGQAGTPGTNGTAGQMGNQGPPGEKGLKGDTGINGISGVDGKDGEEGLPGSPGPKGVYGSPGVPGTIGAPGSRGPDGRKGEVGAKGLPGDKGVIGDVGRKGEQGVNGQAGVRGPQGDTGQQGSPGAKGDQGDLGLPGPIGAQGERGKNGSVGDQGAAGVNGEAGPTGPPGTRGPMGRIGLNGDKGAVGDPGPKGTGGPMGAQGPPGPPGPYVTGYSFLNSSDFCLTRGVGVYSHPLNCWRYIECRSDGSPHERLCLAGRRFVPTGHRNGACQRDNSCIFGAPSFNITAVRAAAMTSIIEEETSGLSRMRKGLSMYSGITIILIIVVLALAMAVGGLYVMRMRSTPSPRRSGDTRCQELKRDRHHDAVSIISQQV